MNLVGFREIEIARIAVPRRLRRIDDAWVAALAANIAEHGLHQPVTVRRFADDSGVDQPDRYVLVAGAHRLAAVGSLDRVTVTAEVVDVDDLTARLIEIDENLFRRELSVLDRAKFLAERKALYQELHPETKRGKAGAAARWGMQTTALSFASDTAERIGLTGRTVDRYVALWAKLEPVARDALELHPIANNASELKALAKLPPAAQRLVVAYLQGGVHKRVAHAVAEAYPHAAKPVPDPAGRLISAWQRSGRRGKTKFLRHLIGIDVIDSYHEGKVR